MATKVNTSSVNTTKSQKKAKTVNQDRNAVRVDFSQEKNKIDEQVINARKAQNLALAKAKAKKKAKMAKASKKKNKK